MRKFDLVQLLLTLAGRVQARRVARAKAKVAAYRFAIQAATDGLLAAEKARVEVGTVNLTAVVK